MYNAEDFILICPNCKAVIKADTRKCPSCGIYLNYSDRVVTETHLPVPKLLGRIALVLLAALVTICLTAFIVLRVHYERQNREITEKYVHQVVEPITFENGVKGHALTFFGTDGDCVYIEELGKSYMFVGGIARVEFEDYIWFAADPTEQQSATVTFSPIYVSATGQKTRIPVFTVEIEVPEAPVTIVTPKNQRTAVLTSTTGLQMNVVYGSRVIINGEDVSDQIDRSGNLNLTLNILPIGDNSISIIVRTDHHKEARRDIVFEREEMDIVTEIANSVQFSSAINYMTINGTTEPGAYITVDTDYDAKSMFIDQETGKFSFQAKFSGFGSNLVSFTAKMDGRRDTHISFYVNYIPSKAEYTRNAWTMDYAQLRLYYEQWTGKVFLCMGKIRDVITADDGTRYYIMNVGNDENVKLVALDNQSNIGTLKQGEEYAMYADVVGRIFYEDNYVPALVTRYSKD